MTAKKNSTEAGRISSIYRRQIDMDRKLDETLKLLADHLTRVLRQNDTLRQALGRKEIAQLASANSFMAHDGAGPQEACRTHGDYACLRWWMEGKAYGHPSNADCARWAKENPDE